MACRPTGSRSSPQCPEPTAVKACAMGIPSDHTSSVAPHETPADSGSRRRRPRQHWPHRWPPPPGVRPTSRGRAQGPRLRGRARRQTRFSSRPTAEGRRPPGFLLRAILRPFDETVATPTFRTRGVGRAPMPLRGVTSTAHDRLKMPIRTLGRLAIFTNGGGPKRTTPDRCGERATCRYEHCDRTAQPRFTLTTYAKSHSR